MKKQIILSMVIVSLINGCMIKQVVNGKGHGGKHKAPATIRVR